MSRRNTILSVALIAATSVTLAGVATGAVFTDTEAMEGTEFVAGTVSLGANPVSTPLALDNAAPGAKTTSAIKVANTGTLAERYAVVAKTDAPASDALAAQLVLTVKTGVATCTAAGFDATGTVAYTGPLASTAGVQVLGDAAVGQQGGDRTLNAGTEETLCAQVHLPLSSGNEFQGKRAAASLIFNAEQVVNNP